MSYRAPLDAIHFTLAEIAGLAELAPHLPEETASPETVSAVLEGAGRLAEEVMAPLNASGDREGCRLENGRVRTPAGFPQAYRAFADGGWCGLPFAARHGGQEMPWLVAAAAHEMWQGANMSLALCPLLSTAALELLQSHGSPEQQRLFMPKLMSGAWTGTMNLTEPQAGSDVGALTTQAEPAGSHYRLKGQKIFISWGDHDCADNIVHAVLARTPGAPAGTRGLSLFIVPKQLPDEDGTPGAMNDVRCLKLEEKLGIHGSPTAVMSYGESSDGAVAYLVGEECHGMSCMFTMMKNARLMVGIQGVGLSERATQIATAYARERLQGRLPQTPGDQSVAILEHPDIRRECLAMRALTDAGRALAYTGAAALDLARNAPDPARREAAEARANLLTPIVKAWCTDIACEVASRGIQVHGGMGYIEETGAAQFLRDARILPIYEGTNGIQAADLVHRKVLRDGGDAARRQLAEIAAFMEGLEGALLPDGELIVRAFAAAFEALKDATETLLSRANRDSMAAAAVATPYLASFGTVLGGWLLLKGALAARTPEVRSRYSEDLLRARIGIARFYALNILPRALGDAQSVLIGAGSILESEDDFF